MIFFKRQEDRQNGEYETRKESRGQIEKTFRPGRSAKCADASQILWVYGGYTSLTMVVNGRNEEGGGGHQSNRELANTDLDQTTQLLFSTKTCSPTVPSEFRFSPALAHSFLYNPVQMSPPSRFDEVSVSSTDSTKPNQIGQAVDLGTGYQERETTLE